jgi:steroid delta-isomerase-like uncharacterized protein
MAGEAEIEIARRLFAAWSSGDADAPQEFLTADAVLHDVTDGRDKSGWAAIRAFFGLALKVWPDVVLEPQEYWTSERGVALRWSMSATSHDGIYGAENDGKKWHSEGMSYLEFRDGKVCRELDYHDAGAGRRSLQPS